MIKESTDVVAAGVGIAAFFGVISAIAAIFTILWYLLRFYEKFTGLEFHKTPLANWLKRLTKEN